MAKIGVKPWCYSSCRASVNYIATCDLLQSSFFLVDTSFDPCLGLSDNNCISFPGDITTLVSTNNPNTSVAWGYLPPNNYTGQAPPVTLTDCTNANTINTTAYSTTNTSVYGSAYHAVNCALLNSTTNVNGIGAMSGFTIKSSNNSGGQQQNQKNSASKGKPTPDFSLYALILVSLLLLVV